LRRRPVIGRLPRSPSIDVPTPWLPIFFPPVCSPGQIQAQPCAWADSFPPGAAGVGNSALERWAGPVTVGGVWHGHPHQERVQAAEPGGGDGCAVPAGDGVIRVRDREADEPSVRIAVKHPLGEATDQIRGKTPDSPARSDPSEKPRTHQPEAMGTWGRCITPRKAIAGARSRAW
jgi:hypothetical protein